MTSAERELATVTIVVEDFEGDGRRPEDLLRARILLNGIPACEVTFSLSHLDFMRTNEMSFDEIADVWDCAIEEMATRLASELNYSGLQRFATPISVHSHVSSLRGPHRAGLRQPSVVLATFQI